MKSSKKYVSDHPSLMEKWDHEENAKLGWFPEKITESNQRKVHWICHKGHKYTRMVFQERKSQPGSCPVCHGHKRATKPLSETHPELVAKEWCFERNSAIDLHPDQVTHGSAKKAYWVCAEGHVSLKEIGRRTYGKGCAECLGRHVKSFSGPVSETHPHLMGEWDFEKNEAIGLDPDQLTAGSEKRPHWKCVQGHEWVATLKNRTLRKSGCAKCIGRTQKHKRKKKSLFESNPELVEFWDDAANDLAGFDHRKITAGSSIRAFWVCEKGHKWSAVVKSLARGIRCPDCNESTGEKAIAGVLDGAGIEFEREVTFDDCKSEHNWKFRFDFGLKKSGKLLGLVEFHGVQHFIPREFFGGAEAFVKRAYDDRQKRRYCQTNGIPLLTITHKDMDRIPEMIGTYWDQLNS